MIVPSGGWGYHDLAPAPEWTTVYPFLLREMYRVYGDERLARDHWAPLVRYLDWEIGRLQDGLAVTALGDWLPPGYGGNPPEDTRLTATAYLHRALTGTAELADLLGDTEVAARYRRTAEALKEAFNAAFLGADGHYRTAKDPDYRQTSNCLPLAFGLVPPGARASVVDSLLADIARRGNHLNTGALGTSVLLRELSAQGHPRWPTPSPPSARTRLGVLVRQRRRHHVGDVAARLPLPGPLLPGHRGAVALRERGGPAPRRRGLPHLHGPPGRPYGRGLGPHLGADRRPGGGGVVRRGRDDAAVGGSAGGGDGGGACAGGRPLGRRVAGRCEVGAFGAGVRRVHGAAGELGVRDARLSRGRSARQGRRGCAGHVRGSRRRCEGLSDRRHNAEMINPSPTSAPAPRVPVVIIGAGPAGLTVANILRAASVDCVVLETESREFVEQRPRAGFIEEWAVRALRHRGLADRLVERAQAHGEYEFQIDGEQHPLPVRDADRGPALRLSAAAAGDGPGTRVRRREGRRDPFRCAGRRPARHRRRPPDGALHRSADG